jgi:hypothetical protein
MSRYLFVSLTILLGLSLHGQAVAAIYKWVGPDGKIVYTDQPRPGAKEVELPKFPPPPPAKPAQADKATPDKKADTTAEPAFPGYKKVALVKPEEDATVRENSGVVEVALELEPAWDPKLGHKITVSLDGKNLPETYTAPQFQLQNIDRGSHSLQVTVNDAKDVPLSTSNSVTFHMKRQSVNFVQKNPMMAPRVDPPDSLLQPFLSAPK